ncbi:MAG: zinc-dependent metalloprotease [Flavitalea sp.]
MTMNYAVRKLMILAFFLTFISAAYSQNKKTIPPTPDTTRPVAVILTSPPKSGLRPYKELITDKTVTKKGLVWVHRNEEKWYFEIGDTLLNRDILVVNRIAKAPANTRSGSFGYAGDEINENVIRFEKGPNNKIFLRSISYSVYAQDTAGPMYKSVMNSNVQPIIAAFDIRAFAKENTGSVIEVTDLLNSDNDIFFFANSYKAALRVGGLQPDKSYTVEINTYPINTEIRTVKTYSRTSGSAVGGLPSGYSTFELNSSMVLLPSLPMRPRYFDDRVSYLTTEYTDFDVDPQGVKNISIITRWRMEPKAEDVEKYKNGELVEPKKPIIFYIDPATPTKWVPYLIQGVNDWQKCFEKAGFKNAIVAKRAPTKEEDSTWSLEDARYSAIVYKPSDAHNAEGPHVHDPRTGEILESHINWYHNVLSLLHRWYMIQAGASDPRARKIQLDDSLMGQLVRFASAHEVGHTLGLPHNMGASFATPIEKLRDKKWLAKNGHTSSIMDYARFNYVAQPEDSVGEMGLLPRIGDYDLWSIEWGYRLFFNKTSEEEKKILNDWVKSKSSNPRLRFIHDDNFDPRAQAEDLGDDAMKAGTYGIKNLKRIIPQLPAWLSASGENFARLEDIYNEAVSQYSRYLAHAIMNIGGVYVDEKTSDQTGPVYRVVPRTVQKEAMVFIRKNLFETPAWLMDKKILNLTTSPVNDRISSMQDSYLGSMLITTRLQRIISAGNREKNTYQLDEYFEDLKTGIWSELPTHKPIDNFKRNLQKSFVERLINIVNPQASGGGFYITLGPVTEPKKSDIYSVAKATLKSLRKDINKALPDYSDKMSKYHLEDVLERIDKVLKKD